MRVTALGTGLPRLSTVSSRLPFDHGPRTPSAGTPAGPTARSHRPEPRRGRPLSLRDRGAPPRTRSPVGPTAQVLLASGSPLEQAASALRRSAVVGAEVQ